MNLKDAAVLFVEDEPFLRESMCKWLEQKAGKAFCAEHGAAALKILATNKVDIVVSDLRMPVMDGVALVKKLHKIEPQPRIILVTGFSDLSLREAYEMGVDAVLEKPIDREQLLRAMEHSLAIPEELWAKPLTEQGMKLSLSFPSLAEAVKQKSIAFGRRGFCIKSGGAFREGLVDFALEFRADRRILSGQGVVRWAAGHEGQAGIEITSLDDASRPWVLDLVKRRTVVAYIPGSTGTRNAAKLDAA